MSLSEKKSLWSSDKQEFNFDGLILNLSYWYHGEHSENLAILKFGIEENNQFANPYGHRLRRMWHSVRSKKISNTKSRIQIDHSCPEKIKKNPQHLTLPVSCLPGDSFYKSKAENNKATSPQ